MSGCPVCGKTKHAFKIPATRAEAGLPAVQRVETPDPLGDSACSGADLRALVEAEGGIAF